MGRHRRTLIDSSLSSGEKKHSTTPYNNTTQSVIMHTTTGIVVQQQLHQHKRCEGNATQTKKQPAAYLAMQERHVSLLSPPQSSISKDGDNHKQTPQLNTTEKSATSQ